MKKKYLIGVVIVVLVLVGAAYGFYEYNRPVASIAKKDADFTLTATKLVDEYEENEESANEKYLDEVLLVKGEVYKIEKQNNATSVYLKSGNPISSVIVELEEPLTKEINPGDQVQLKGVCTGYLMDVVLVRGVLENKS